MLILRGNTDKLQLVTASAVDIEVHVSAMQADNAAPPVVQALRDMPADPRIDAAATVDDLNAIRLPE